MKIAKVIALFKGGIKSNPNNYRPISLLSHFDEIFVKILCKRLVTFLEQIQPLLSLIGNGDPLCRGWDFRFLDFRVETKIPGFFTSGNKIFKFRGFSRFPGSVGTRPTVYTIHIHTHGTNLGIQHKQ